MFLALSHNNLEQCNTPNLHGQKCTSSTASCVVSSQMECGLNGLRYRSKRGVNDRWNEATYCRTTNCCHDYSHQELAVAAFHRHQRQPRRRSKQRKEASSLSAPSLTQSRPRPMTSADHNHIPLKKLRRTLVSASASVHCPEVVFSQGSAEPLGVLRADSQRFRQWPIKYTNNG